MGLGKLAAQTLVLLGQLDHTPGFSDGGIGFATALAWFKRSAFGNLALLTPRSQLRGIDALAAQQRTNLADCGAAIRCGQNAVLLLTGELTPLGGGCHFRIRRGHRTARFIHRCLAISHDLDLPFYSNL